MRLYLINPSNPLISVANVRANRWNRYRVSKPLGLLVLAGLTPPEWDITVLDENRGVPDYAAMPRPDLVGISAFTSQANRAYEVAAEFRRRGVSVVMGGIHATMCRQEALRHVDSVVTGEAESLWATVLDDARRGQLQRTYAGEQVDMADDEELLTLAARAGCRGVFIGFESPTAQGLEEVGKKFNLLRRRDFKESVRRIQRHNILVVGSFIIGLDADTPGIGKRIAKAARNYGLDILNALSLVSNLSYRKNARLARESYGELDLLRGQG